MEKSPRAEGEGLQLPGVGAPGLFEEEPAASPRKASAGLAGNNDTSFGETMAAGGARRGEVGGASAASEAEEGMPSSLSRAAKRTRTAPAEAS